MSESKYDFKKSSDLELAVASLDALQLRWVTKKDDFGNGSCYMAITTCVDSSLEDVIHKILLDIGLNTEGRHYEEKDYFSDKNKNNVDFRITEKGMTKLLDAGVRIPVLDKMVGYEEQRPTLLKSILNRN